MENYPNHNNNTIEKTPQMSEKSRKMLIESLKVTLREHDMGGRVDPDSPLTEEYYSEVRRTIDDIEQKINW